MTLEHAKALIQKAIDQGPGSVDPVLLAKAIKIVGSAWAAR